MKKIEKTKAVTSMNVKAMEIKSMKDELKGIEKALEAFENPEK